MKKLFTAIAMLISVIGFSQTTGYFRYDSVRFEKQGSSSEFILLNSTRNVTGGVLTNIGNGRTAFVIPSGGGISDGNKTDITVSGSGVTWVINNNAIVTAKINDGAVTTAKIPDGAITTPKLADAGITYIKIQPISAVNRVLGRVVSSGPPEELTGTQVTAILDAFNSSLKGLVPASGGGTTNFLRADGTWAVPPGSGGGGSLSNLGAKFELGVTGTSNLKTLQEGYNAKFDSTGTILTLNFRDTIYVLATGQSNTAGHQFAGETYYDTTGSAFVQGWNPTSDTWVRLKQAVIPMGSNTPGVQYSAPEDSSMGAYFYVAQLLHQKTGKVVRVFQLGFGGNAIDNWLPESSTNFARIKTELAAAGNPHIDYFIWAQGESDASMSDTAYKRRIDSLTAQLDRQSWFGQDVPMLMVSVTNTGVNYQMMQIQKAIYSGLYDKRYKLIDGTGQAVTSDNIHYTSQSQFNLAKKMMQSLFNEINMPANYESMDSTERERLRLYAPRIGLPRQVVDPTSNRRIFLKAPFIQIGDEQVNATIAATKFQQSELEVYANDDSTFNAETFSIRHKLTGNLVSGIKFMRGASGSNTGYLSFFTSNATYTEKMTLGQTGDLTLLSGRFISPQISNTPSATFGGSSGINIQANAATNNNFIASNITYNSGFKLVANGTGMLDYFDAAGPRVWQYAASGVAGASATLTSVFMVKGDGSVGLGGTGMGTSISSTANAAIQISSGGNVGIGIAPSVKFHVDGAHRYANLGSAITDTSTYKPMVIDGSGNVRPATYWYGGSGGGGGSYSAGFGLSLASTTFSADTTSGGVLSWVRGKKIIDSLISLGASITIGTSPITSGTVGRVLFQGSGNVVQQSSNLFWDNTNGWLGLRTSSPGTTVDIAAGHLRVQGFTAPTSGSGVEMLYASNQGHLYAITRGAGTTRDLIIGSDNVQGFFKADGTVGIHNSSPTAYLHVGAGTSSVAAFGLTSGTDLSSPAAGMFYYNGTRLGFSPSTTIKRIALTNDAAPSNGQIPIGNGTDYTVATLASADGTITYITGAGTLDLSAAGSWKLANVSTSNATPTTIATISPASGEAGVLEVNLSGIKNDGNDAVTGKKIVRWIRNGGGTLTLGSITDDLSTVADGSISTATWTITTGGSSIVVQVTGVAATTINWNVKYLDTRSSAGL